MPDRLPEQQTPALLGRLPSVHRLLAMPAMIAAAETVPAALAADAARTVLQRIRHQILSGNTAFTMPSDSAIANAAAREAYRRMSRSLRRAVNATGVVLHTGLGRARLANAARDALIDVAGAHSTLEIDTETGQRGSRREHVRGILCELTGAEDAAVVNNCAAAVLLAVTVMAAGKEVIISRGELVEIGGAFRMPDIVRAGGATLVEVGTTNRTRISDYASAITDRTGLILRCHPSNFAIVGFTEEARISELVQLGRERGIPVMDDQGSGALAGGDIFGHSIGKGSLNESIASGCAIVTASGDKLLGGPQAGILLGNSLLIDRIVSHPLSRALRVDKFTLAALEATLRLYRDPASTIREIPTLRYLSRSLAELTDLAETLAARMTDRLGADFTVTTIPERSQVGGGSLPGEELPTTCVSLRARTGHPSANEIADHIRRQAVPIFARIKSDAVLFDPRTLEPDEIDTIAAAVGSLIVTD